MKKIKEWYKENKTVIIVSGCTCTAVLIGIGCGYVFGRSSKQFVDRYAGKTVLSWLPVGKFISVEEAKKVLDLNSMGEGIYALVQEAPNVFTWVVCNDKVIPL